MFELGKFCLKVLDLSFELVIHVLSFLDFRLHFGNYLLVTLNLNPGLWFEFPASFRMAAKACSSLEFSILS